MNTKEKIYKMHLYKSIDSIQSEGGTIATARFEDPQLQYYSGDVEINDNKLSIEASINHSKNNEMIYSGLSLHYYTYFHDLLENKEKELTVENVINNRFMIIIEHQAILSLASMFETFIRRLLPRKKKRGLHQNFKSIENVLKSISIDLKTLAPLDKENHYQRMKEIIDYLFMLRNLIIHNGGVVNKSFYNRYKKQIDKSTKGKIIRVNNDDIKVIRQWISFLVQKICEQKNGYETVWQDWLFSSGIILMNKVQLFETSSNGKNIIYHHLKEGKMAE